jgi:micrococcal nuclease
MGLCISNFENRNLAKYDDNSVELFSLNNKIVYAKIVKVYDGDTCYAVFMLNGKPVKFHIRMEGYDSPEMKPLLKILNRKKIIKDAKLAKTELENIVLNKIVKLHCGTWDKYGRLLAKLYVDELCVNSHMIENGFGYEYFGGTKKM